MMTDNNESVTFTLSSPITDEELDEITDVELEHTNYIWFETPSGKQYKFVKERVGKWIKNMKVIETPEYKAFDPEWYCSCCNMKYDHWITPMVKYCLNCGARFEEERNEQSI